MEASDLDTIHEFWFGDFSQLRHFPQDRFPLWFIPNDRSDAHIRSRFGEWVRQAADRDWSLEGLTLAQQVGLVVLLDQVPRSAFRGTPRAYEADCKARELARRMIAEGLDRFRLIERIFVILPLGHSENLVDQDTAVELAERHYFSLADPQHHFALVARRQAVHHRDTIRRFGRFPHRNSILGRVSTAEEADFIASAETS